MRVLPLAILVASSAPELTYAQESEKTNGDEEKSNAEEYVEGGHIEVGGSVGGSFEEEEWSISVSPSIGYYLVDRVELTFAVGLTYTREEDELGLETTTVEAELILEPSYHHPFGENLLGLVGVGVGTGWDGDHGFFEIVPRLGLNVLTTRSSAITPSVRLPIVFGRSEGDMGEFGSSVSLTFDIAVTTSF
jgi:hypothetical protein